MYTHGGLLGEYWGNIWLQGVPDIARPDPEIDFTWVVDSLIIPTAGDYITIRWTGLILPPTA